MYEPIGKIKLTRDGAVPRKLDLWAAAGSTKTKGRIRVQDLLQALEWEVVLYVDENEYEVHISAHENKGPFKGFSTDIFYPDQELKIVGRKHEEQGNSNMKIDSYNDAVMKTSSLEECEDFTKLQSLFDQLLITSSEIKGNLESISSLSLA